MMFVVGYGWSNVPFTTNSPFSSSSWMICSQSEAHRQPGAKATGSVESKSHVNEIVFVDDTINQDKVERPPRQTSSITEKQNNYKNEKAVATSSQTCTLFRYSSMKEPIAKRKSYLGPCRKDQFRP